MTDGKPRQIPIEDGSEDKAAADNAGCAEETMQAECAGETTGASAADEGRSSEPAGEAEECCGAGDGESEDKKEDKTDDAEAGEADRADGQSNGEEKSAEEQESERYMRLMAEFQNFKRRSAREKADIHAYANEKIVGELLPVLDNFERALGTRYDDIDAYAKGMELIFTQLRTALEHAGLEEIAALGEDFDPNIHNAVMTEQSEEHEDGKVSKVLQKGYKLKDKVIRPSMVAVVSN